MTVDDTSGTPVPSPADQAGTAASAHDHHAPEAAQALFAATAQIGLALRESQEPVAELGCVLARLAESLSAASPGPELRQQLHADVFKGIQQLQFYDRMVQHLSHLQDYLICIANELDSPTPQPAVGDVWAVLHAKLRQRLISDEQRSLFDLLLTPDKPTRVSAQAVRSDYSAPGSLEMF
jgi:hypothetical protein